MAMLLPNAKQYFTDQNGNPLVGGKLFFYQPNTTTPKDTWQDAGKVALNTNPVILDSFGTAKIYGEGLYRVILQDATGVQIYDQTTAGIATAAMIAAGTDDQATVTAKGLADAGFQAQPFASDAEAIAGVVTDKVMSPETTKLAATTTQADGGYMGDLSALNSIGLSNVNPLSAPGKLLGSTATDDDVAELTPNVGISIVGSNVFAQSVGRRQTVALGPVSTSGLPIFWAASYPTLDLQFFNISTTEPFVVIAANGSNTRIGVLTANPANFVVAPSTTSYIYADVAADGTVTIGAFTLAPAYITGSTPSTTFGQFSYDIAKKKAYVGTGSGITEVYRVIIGEVVAGASVISSAVCYAYNGRFNSALTAIPVSGTAATFNHNIGVRPFTYNVQIVCISSNVGYSANDYAFALSDNGSNGQVPIASLSGTNQIRAIYNSTLVTTNKGTGAFGNITTANWNYFAYADRGWD
jgi:hypothetical protein